MVIIPIIIPITILWDMMGVLYHFPIRTFEDLKIGNCNAEMFEGVNLYIVYVQNIHFKYWISSKALDIVQKIFILTSSSVRFSKPSSARQAPT